VAQLLHQLYELYRAVFYVKGLLQTASHMTGEASKNLLHIELNTIRSYFAKHITRIALASLAELLVDFLPNISP
jgi:hypothetical protein